MCAHYAHAQVVVVPAGGDGTLAAFSVGQAVAGEAVGEKGSAEIGIQQPYMLVVEGFGELAGMQGAVVSVYPNPTSSLLRVDVTAATQSDVTCRLYSEQGMLLEQKDFSPSVRMEIDISAYPAGNYVLHLLQDGHEGAYQIIKK